MWVALDEGFAHEQPEGDSASGTNDGARATQKRGRRTPSARVPRVLTSSWPECSTIPGAAIVPKVTASREIRIPVKLACLLKAARRQANPGANERGRGTSERRETGLCASVVMVTMVAVVVMCGGEGRASEHQDQQDSGEELFHSQNLA